MSLLCAQTLATEPAGFIQHLAIQNQILACVKWLTKFQVLACIPLHGSISIEEIAELASVPEALLARVVRMTATVGFLQEPQPGYFAHTRLSTPFVTNLAFLDATMFLADTAAPAALHMAAATQHHGQSTAYSIAFPASQPFPAACIHNTKLQRQWSAYCRCVGAVDNGVTELINRLKWRSLGNACVVDACAHSTDTVLALADMYPSLRFVVQMIDTAQDGNGNGHINGFSERITVQRRLPAAVQEVSDAGVYLLRPTSLFAPLPAQLLAELNAHFHVLRANTAATLILALPLLPESKAVNPDVEAKARLRDLCRLQLTDQCEMELSEVLEIINSVSDVEGRLVAVSKVRCSQSAAIALGIQYQAYADTGERVML